MTRAAKILSAAVTVACVCGQRFVALVHLPDWQARCPKCAALWTITVALEMI